MKTQLYKIIYLFICLLISSTLAAIPQAVIFDFGGVMNDKARRVDIVPFLRDSLRLSKEEFQVANAKRKKAINNGMTDLEFWLGYAKDRNVELPEDWASQFLKAMYLSISPSDEMYALVAELKQNNIQVGMLSNVDQREANLIRNFGLYKPFHPCILSCDMSVQKPDERIYRILLISLGLHSRNVVFIDDRQENIEAAQTLGIDAILFQSPEQIREELDVRFKN